MNYDSISYSTLVAACLPDLGTKSSFRTRVQISSIFDRAVESCPKRRPKKIGRKRLQMDQGGWTRVFPQRSTLSSVCPTSCGFILPHIGLVPIDSNIILECNAGVYLQHRIEKACSTTELRERSASS